MSLYKKLVKEENDLNQRILNNRRSQYDYLVQLSKQPLSDKITLDNKLEVFEKLRELEAVIEKQLSDMSNSQNRSAMYRMGNDKAMRDEKLRVMLSRKAEEKYRGMKLKDLLKSYYDSSVKKTN